MSFHNGHIAPGRVEAGQSRERSQIPTMCLHFFAPGRELHIDYASESVSLIKGGNEFVLDVLLTNHSANEIDRIHIVYPHGISYSGEPRGASVPSYLEDITSTWLEKESPYNRFYATDQIPFDIEEAPGGTLRITLSITDPKNIAKKLPYVGLYADSYELVHMRFPKVND